jgi:hypothetical protein
LLRRCLSRLDETIFYDKKKACLYMNLTRKKYSAVSSKFFSSYAKTRTYQKWLLYASNHKRPEQHKTPRMALEPFQVNEWHMRP